MEVGDLLPLGITLVVVTVALAFGIQVTGEVKTSIGETDCAARTDGFTTFNTSSNQCVNSTGGHASVGTASWNGTQDGITGIEKLTGKLPTVGLVIAAVVIIAILVKGFSKAA